MGDFDHTPPMGDFTHTPLVKNDHTLWEILTIPLVKNDHIIYKYNI
jgi:hypothetical protein